MQAKKPRTLCCYLCGKEFGLSSLQIHMKTCQSKWLKENQESKKQIPDAPPQLAEIIAKGPKVSNAQLQAYNSIAFDMYNKVSLAKCYGCGRTFLPDRLEIHLRSCKEAKAKPQLAKKSGVKSSGSKSGFGGGASGIGGGGASGGLGSSSKAPKGGPKSLVCFLCGKGFMKTSIMIHLKKCQEVFTREEQQKSGKDRRDMPQAPMLLSEIVECQKIDLDKLQQYNDQAFKMYNEQALVKCVGCGRTFLPDRLHIHQKSCKGSGSGASPPGGKCDAAKKLASRPKTLMCYICGREFGTTSLEIHLKSCQKKWEQQEALKPKNQRRPVPKPPKNFDQILSGAGDMTTSQLQQFNNQAFEDYNTKALVKCDGCGRTFLPDSLVIHQRSCKSSSGAAGSKGPGMAGSSGGMGGSGASSSPMKIPKRPKTLMCYICGRQYGTTSLKIHIKSCREKWQIQQAKKPKHQRRPCPEPPKDFDNIIAKAGQMNTDQLQEYNNQAFDDYNTKALIPCQICGRTFKPESLVIHSRSCKPKDSMKSSKSSGAFKPPATLGVSGGGFEDAKKSPAPSKSSGVKIPVRPKTIIGREFGTASLPIHIKSCKQKWEIQESKKPASQRKPVPEPPKDFDQIVAKGGKVKMDDLEAYNNQAFDDYNTKALSACPNCGRTFLPDRLEVHLRSCKPKQ